MTSHVQVCLDLLDGSDSILYCIEGIYRDCPLFLKVASQHHSNFYTLLIEAGAEQHTHLV